MELYLIFSISEELRVRTCQPVDAAGEFRVGEETLNVKEEAQSGRRWQVVTGTHRCTLTHDICVVKLSSSDARLEKSNNDHILIVSGF